MIWDLGEDLSHFLVLLHPKAHENKAIVNALYLLFLGRETDPDGAAHHVKKLDDGASLRSLARSVHFSQEGKAYAARVPQTKTYYRVYAWTTFPVLGKRYAKALISEFKRKELAAVSHKSRKVDNVVLFDTNCAASPAALKLLAALNAERLRQC